MERPNYRSGTSAIWHYLSNPILICVIITADLSNVRFDNGLEYLVSHVDVMQ
jgi:hypothetical protein